MSKDIWKLQQQAIQIGRKLNDYPTLLLDPGEYLFLITNDIRYLETAYDITVNVNKVDFELINETAIENIDFGTVVNSAADEINFGQVISWYKRCYY